jgi:hypothetical protein
VRVDQDRRLAEQRRHAAFGELEATGPARLRPGERDRLVQHAHAGDVREPPRTGERVDDPALPGQAAEDRLGAAGGRDPCGRQRADDISAAADADAERAARAPQDVLRR